MFYSMAEIGAGLIERGWDCENVEEAIEKLGGTTGETAAIAAAIFQELRLIRGEIIRREESRREKVVSEFGERAVKVLEEVVAVVPENLREDASYTQQVKILNPFLDSMFDWTNPNSFEDWVYGDPFYRMHVFMKQLREIPAKLRCGNHAQKRAYREWYAEYIKTQGGTANATPSAESVESE